MNLYAAAVFTNNYMPGQRLYQDFNDRERLIVEDLPYILESYHYVKGRKYVVDMRRNGAKVFLDSGAFSSYTLGVELKLTDYVQYIKDNIDIIRVEDGVLMASVLDGIGDPLLTYQNQKAMEYYGVTPLPCFHAGEDERYLEYYVENYPYITLGGMVGSSTQQLIVWLDRIWDRYLVDGSGRPKVKVHGFGITAIPLMERYPWWSCDSSSWIQATSFGGIVTPEFGPLNISDKSPSRHTAGQHISTLTPIEREHVVSTIEAAGFTYERLSTVYQSRAAYNLMAYRRIGENMRSDAPETFQAKIQELF